MYLVMRTAGIYERLYADMPEAQQRPLPSNLAQINLTNAPLMGLGLGGLGRKRNPARLELDDWECPPKCPWTCPRAGTQAYVRGRPR